MSRERYFSSPCLMGQTTSELDELYIASVSKKWIDLLQELLMAERAGLRVATESMRESLSADVLEVIKRVWECEARSCKVLREILLGLGEMPTIKIGNFYAKAMAKQDIQERIAFIDRGRDWVFNKVDSELENCPHKSIGAALISLREMHRHQINMKS